MVPGQSVYIPVLDTGPEPIGLQQLKVIALTRETDGSNAADIDVYLTWENCAGTEAQRDISRDYKSMTKVGPEAGGEKVCVKLEPYHIPPGSSRTVQVVFYYSGDTAMR
jgi:hypothetical protein